MAYMNKAKLKLASQLALTVKVKSKACSTERATHGASPEWHTLWDSAEYAHMALEVVLGTGPLDTLERAAEHNPEARNALARIQGHTS
jgi:hypothetical protein